MSSGCTSNLKGKRFGKLLVLRKSKSKRWNCGWWFVRCDCGNKVLMRTWAVQRSVQCALCARSQRGMTQKYCGEYNSWNAMRQRCFNPNNPDYKNYGGCGITVCDRWLGQNGFVNFIMDLGKRPEDKTLDRKNAFGNYEPGNCRWAGDATQARNQRCRYSEEKAAVLQEEAIAMNISVEEEVF